MTSDAATANLGRIRTEVARALELFLARQRGHLPAAAEQAYWANSPAATAAISGPRPRPPMFDPGFTAEVPPLPDRAAADDHGRLRWDGQDLRAFTGSYGDYLLGKVSKVFPQLQRDVL